MKNLFIILILLICQFNVRSQSTYRKHYVGQKEFFYDPVRILNLPSDQHILFTSSGGFILKPGFELKADPNRSVTFKVGEKAPASEDFRIKWTKELLFDENGIIYAGSKSFYDVIGLNVQNQSLLVEEEDVLVTHTIYDKFGNPVINTLPIPLDAEGFRYNHSLVTTGGQPYNNTHFTGNLEENPEPIDKGKKGTLGWYYSQNNTEEPFVDASTIPYSRVKYYKYKSGEVQKSAGVGEAFQLGSGREVSSHIMGSYDLPDLYFSIAEENGIQLQEKKDFKVIENITVGSDGKFSRTYSDLKGNVLVSSIKSNVTNSKKWEIPLGEFNTIDIYDEFVDKINNTGYYATKIELTHSGESGSFAFLDKNDNLISSSAASPYTLEGTEASPLHYKIISEEPFEAKIYFGLGGFTYFMHQFSSSHKEPYNNKQAGSYLYIPECATNISFKGTEPSYFFKVYNISTDVINTVRGSVIADYLNPGEEYEITFNGSDLIKDKDQPYITYNSCEGNESYNYYNTRRQLIVSITPKGVDEYKAGVPYAQIDKTTYTYNNRGFLVSTTSNDAGTTNYKYAKDGRIRFSQNSEQAGRNRPAFSYTDYDEIGRPIESGEYVGFWDDLQNLQFAQLDALLEDRGPNPWTDNYQVDWIRTYYDLPAVDLPLFSELGKQRFTYGNVSWTENENSATYYSYDDLGRVEWMVQKNDFLPEAKKVEYTYDFLGNVLEVAYQAGKTDAFYHHYEYDKSKRLKKVYTSLDGNTKRLQATYHYYMHGPLKRVELGEKTQGIDYVYNINGMLKEINSPNKDLDPGKDGSNGFAEDVFGAFYKYYNNDYKKNNKTLEFVNIEKSFGKGKLSNENFNGNITSLVNRNNLDQPYVSSFNYDDRNQLISSYIVPHLVDRSPNFYGVDNIHYDLNGNIKSLVRTTPSGTINDFTYHYQTPTNTNQLSSVTDTQGPSRNYQYNSIGQMISQSGVNTQSLTYNAMGLVKGINSPAGNATYTYDDRGFRLRSSNSLGANNETIYIRDATGNVLSIYNKSGSTYTQAEVPIYGASRLGSYQKSNANRTVYELKDHLGNVRAVIDRNKNSNGDPVVYQSTDYWPFGMVLRSTINGERYRYGYQGEYAEDETEETGYNGFQLRLYDPIIGRWFAPDPYGQYPSPYLSMGNNPITNVDPDGGKDFNQGIDKNGNIVFDDFADDGNLFLVNSEFSGEINDLATLKANSTQLFKDFKLVGSAVQLEDYVLSQFKWAGFQNFPKVTTSINSENEGLAVGVREARMLGGKYQTRARPYEYWEFAIYSSRGESVFFSNVYNLRNIIQHEKSHVIKAIDNLHSGNGWQTFDSKKAYKRWSEHGAIDYQRNHSSWNWTSKSHADAIQRYYDTF